MFFFSTIVVLFFASLSSSHPLNISLQDPLTNKFYSFALDNDRQLSIEQLHKSMLASPTTKKDPSTLSFDIKKITIDGHVITRSIPYINGLPVEGADGIYNSDDKRPSFHYTYFAEPEASFQLSAAEAIEKAIALQSNSLISNPYVEKTHGIYEPIWLLHFGALRPAFKVRLPTISIFDLKDIYIDAERGEILQIEDAAQFVTAPSELFEYSPKTPDCNEQDLKAVTLKNLVDLKEGGHLLGEYINVRTCCRYYTCPDGSSTCSDEKKKCALKSHADAYQRHETITLPTQTLGLDALMSLPANVIVDTVRCTYLPFARAGYKDAQKNNLGFYGTPIDRPGLESEIDRFSELQAYYSVTSFFNNMRSLLNDNTWCLRKEAMACNSDGSPVLDENHLPKKPYQIFVNQLIPDMKVESSTDDPSNFINQVLSGKGSQENPIVIDQFTRVGNAAFVPALNASALDKPKGKNPRADEIISDLIKPFDHNVFFQGERDFAYDGDVVFHEFMHAITTSLINKINSLGLDQWGIHSEPGSLNEAWADYFAAAFTNDPAIGEYASTKDSYGEISLRNIDNQASCPNDVIGEIHHDGLIWSGALWEIRQALKKKSGAEAGINFDRVVLQTLAQTKKPTEDFKTQSEKLLSNLENRTGLLEPAAQIAEKILKKRGIKDCFRAFTLSSVDDKNQLTTTKKDLLFIASKTQIGLKNYAPATSQFEIGIPAGAKAVTLYWRQFLGGTGALLGTEVSPESTKNADPLMALFSFDKPISWQFKNGYAVPSKDDLEIKDGFVKASYQNGLWQAQFPLDLKHCEQRTLYASLLSQDFKYVVENVAVNFTMNSDDSSDCNFTGSLRKEVEIPPSGCRTFSSSSAWLLMMVLLLFLRGRGSKAILKSRY